MRLLRGAIAIIGVLFVTGCAWQRQVLYFPTNLPPVVAEQTAAKRGFLPWRNASGTIIGWKLLGNSPATSSILVVHGNAGCALDRGYIASPIRKAGLFDVYVLEYPGYGVREGKPSMTSWLAAGEDAFVNLPHDKPIYLVSESIGTGVAAYIAKKHPDEVAGIAMLVPYNNLAAVAQNKVPILLPYLFLVDRYNPALWLENYSGPIKVVLAGQDEVIPPKFGKKLYDGYNGPKSLQVFPDAGHNDVAAQSPEWWKEVFAFWAQNKQPK